jgi:DNA-binding transcriptional LysR family regulator
MVDDDEADIGIYNAAYPASGVVSMPYRQDRSGLVVPAGHALASREVVRLEEALDYDFLGYFPRHSLEEFMLLAGPTLSRPLRVRAQVSNPEARCNLVREGLGLAVVPTGIARNYEASMGLKVVALSDAWALRQLWVCVRDAAKLSAPARAFLEHLQSGVGRD